MLIIRLVSPVVIFFSVYSVYVLSPVIASGDSIWSVFGAQSLLTEGNLDLDEYIDVLQQKNFYWVDEVNGHYYSRFPIGHQLLSVPFVFLIDKGFKLVFWVSPELEQRLIQSASVPLKHITVTSIYWRVELLISSAIVALSVVFVYLIARRQTTPVRALAVAFVYAFCTSAWSVCSRSMGQHGCSMLMLSIALYLLVLGKDKPRAVPFAALPLAFSFLIRPTNSIPIAMLSAYVLWAHRKQFIPFVLMSLPIALPFFAYNYSIYGAPLAPYYSAARQLGTNGDFINTAVGTLISPARGLFFFTPVLLCCLLGFVWKTGSWRHDKLDWCLAGTILLHWAVVSSFGDWWGGHSYGPRYWSDLLPLMLFYLAPFLDHVAKMYGKTRWTARVAFVLLTSLSFFVHARGATSLETWAWNREPTDINRSPERLWDWRDLMFLRGLN